MRGRRLLGIHFLSTVLALFILAVSLVSVTRPAHAAPLATIPSSPDAPATSALSAAAPTEGAKTTLVETSIDGPSLWTSGTGSVRALIAWTGVDSAHHLNLLSSGDGVSWDAKVTLPETSLFRAGLTRTGPTASDRVVVAWTGTNTNQSLNVLIGNPPASFTKLTLWQDNSFTGPSVAMLNGAIYLIWAGTDAQHTINVDHIVAAGSGLTVQQKTILWGWSARATPTVIFDPTSQRLVMSWAGPDQRIHFAYSTNGTNWTQPSQSPVSELSDTSPMVFSALATNVSTSLPRYFLAWRGVNVAHSVNVKATTSFPYWPQSYMKAILSEQAFGSPSLGSVGASNSLLLAWTGIDAAHHLNVATLSASFASGCVPAASAQPVSPPVIAHGAITTKEVSLTFDSDGGSAGNATTYLNILGNHQVHATFFLTGQFAQANPTVVQRIIRDGHDIGNHVLDHSDLTNPPRTDAFICNELTGADRVISGIAGHSTRPYFRPPFGAYNEQAQYLAAGLGYRTILWSIDPRDWDSTTTASDILNRVLNSPSLGSGAIILMHVNSAHESEALDGVITGLQQRGYKIVPLSQLLQ